MLGLYGLGERQLQTGQGDMKGMNWQPQALRPQAYGLQRGRLYHQAGARGALLTDSVELLVGQPREEDEKRLQGREQRDKQCVLVPLLRSELQWDITLRPAANSATCGWTRRSKSLYWMLMVSAWVPAWKTMVSSSVRDFST